MDLLRDAIVFLVVALIAALIGFTGIAAGAVAIAKILFYIFVVLAIITFVFGLMQRTDLANLINQKPSNRVQVSGTYRRLIGLFCSPISILRKSR